MRTIMRMSFKYFKHRSRRTTVASADCVFNRTKRANLTCTTVVSVIISGLPRSRGAGRRPTAS